MKKVRKNMKMIIGIVIGVIISVTTSYVLAATLINSKDVVYQDNMSIGATNVQNAIDGTCSKIDTRLSAIEDKLYTVQNIYATSHFTSSTSWFYTGISVTLPANSYCSITGSLVYSNSAPNAVKLSKNSTASTSSLAVMDGNYNTYAATIAATYSGYIQNETPVYLWGLYYGSTSDWGEISGFCVTKV